MEKLFKNGFRTVSETELVLVDGGGIASAVAGAIIGCAVGGFVASCRMVGECFCNGSMDNAGEDILTSMIEGAVGGAITEALMPML